MTEGASGDIADLARPSLDRLLAPKSTAPLIIAFSGGGDSLALLIAAKAWADVAGRRLVAVTVDHRLQAGSAAWAAWCQARCRRLGVGCRTLVWAADKPVSGLAAAARAARHGLIADAARAAGARVILMGHTADDLAEGRAMRAAGVRVSDPAEWSPSPAWPEGRGLFILRPLLAARRSRLRDALIEAGETWIDDPANDDLRSPRARARAALAGGQRAGSPTKHLSQKEREGSARPLARGRVRGSTPASLPPHPPMAPPWVPPSPHGRGVSSAAGRLEHVTEGPAGDLAIPREIFRKAPPDDRRALVGAALLCAAGTARPPRGERLDRLITRLAGEGRFVATLAGARVEADGAVVRILREAGDLRRAGARPLALPVGAAVAWDGRFEIEAGARGLAVTALAGLANRLDRADRHALKRVPAAGRPGLPAVIDDAGRITCPSLVPDPRLAIRSLVFPRLVAALGAVQTEAAIGRHGASAPGILDWRDCSATRQVDEPA